MITQITPEALRKELGCQLEVQWEPRPCPHIVYSFTAWQAPKGRSNSISSQNWHTVSLLSPDHRAAINRHHVASFYDKVRGKRVRGERPAGEWLLQVTRIKACAAPLLSPGAGSEAGAEWQRLGSPGASFGGSLTPSGRSCPQPSPSLLLGLQTPCLVRLCGSPGSFLIELSVFIADRRNHFLS